jgi:hypothetical protein
LILRNALGQIVQQISISDPFLTIDMAELPTGMYLCQLEDDRKVIAIGKIAPYLAIKHKSKENLADIATSAHSVQVCFAKRRSKQKY